MPTSCSGVIDEGPALWDAGHRLVGPEEQLDQAVAF